MIKNLFFDAFFAIVVIILFESGVFFVRPALSSTGTPPVRAAVQERWPALPVYDFSRNLWNQIEEVFHEERKKGVLIGNDGWLAANGGFTCPARAAQTLDANMDYVVAARNLLAERNTTLLVVLIPAKGRLSSGYGGANRVPSCQRPVYDKALDYMDRHRVLVVDLLAAMRESPAGAQAAELTGGALKIRNGDLLQNVDSSWSENLPPTEVADAGGSLTDATRVARSPFEQFLQDALRMDLLNVAEEGQGPFPVMDAYLRNAVWRNNPPGLLVWEIPERYLLVKRSARRL